MPDLCSSINDNGMINLSKFMSSTFEKSTVLISADHLLDAKNKTISCVLSIETHQFVLGVK